MLVASLAFSFNGPTTASCVGSPGRLARSPAVRCAYPVFADNAGAKQAWLAKHGGQTVVGSATPTRSSPVGSVTPTRIPVGSVKPTSGTYQAAFGDNTPTRRASLSAPGPAASYVQTDAAAPTDKWAFRYGPGDHTGVNAHGMAPAIDGSRAMIRPHASAPAAFGPPTSVPASAAMSAPILGGGAALSPAANRAPGERSPMDEWDFRHGVGPDGWNSHGVGMSGDFRHGTPASRAK